MKLRKMVFDITLAIFSGNSQRVSGQFSENLKINRKPYENDFGLISRKIIFRKIAGKFSVNVWYIFVFAI